MREFFAVIPARYGSTRLPGKPLRTIAGDILVAHVYAKASTSGAAQTIIATDDERVLAACAERKLDAMLTSTDHRSGTDRCAEVAQRAGWGDEAIVVNVQGDEPLLPGRLIAQVADALAASGADLATLACPIASERDYRDPNVVKVVVDRADRALLFSRAPIPHRRDGQEGWRGARRHIGLYAYRVKTLHRLAGLDSCELERGEALEQLRALWHGLSIAVAQTDRAPGPGVDTEQDVRRVEAWLARATAGPG